MSEDMLHDDQVEEGIGDQTGIRTRWLVFRSVNNMTHAAIGFPV